MKIQFIGAAGEVTGSSHLLHINDKKVLLDCGLYQGKRIEAYHKNRNLLFQPEEIDSVVLSHAHIDHCGNLPTLVKNGFKGNIFSTFATRDLGNVILADSAHIQELDEEYFRKHCNGGNGNEVLYTIEDAEKVMHQFIALDYHREFYINKYIRGTFFDAGHVLGSAITFLNIEENDNTIRFGFTGDLGRIGLPILRDPEMIPEIDYLIIESTYGNRVHDPVPGALEELKDAIIKTIHRGGKIIIPAFALERTQDILYYVELLIKKKEIPDIPVFVDSPLAVDITDIFRVHPECYDEMAETEFTKNKDNPFGFDRVKYITSIQDSKALNSSQNPCIIISASGMCEAGRIRHHLANNIENKKNTILVVGYMADNTLGRKIVEREKMVTIFNHKFHVRSDIITLNAFSGHADKNALFHYVSQYKNLKKIFIVHGEPEQQKPFAERIKNELGIDAVIPVRGEIVELK